MPAMKILINHPLLLVVLATLILFNPAHAKTDDFPGRKQYPNVAYITLDDLFARKDNVTLVDTRSDYEYSTLHIKGAINIPISDIEFSNKVRQIYDDKKKPIVFYCNGHSCTKSYEAVLKAKRFAKVTDAVAFDGGVTDWARRYPEHSVLLGKSPINSADLITEDEFKKHLLKPAAFLEKADKNCLILDVRDGSQRQERIFPGFERSVSLDKDQQHILNKYLDQAISEKKTLCIYDAVGLQVEWLQYHLKAKKVSNYYFMEGGIRAFEDMPKEE
jgi:rhodanese-related sulfurtransferase